MKFPLELSFKIVTISSKLFVKDADGQLLAFVKQKKFRFKEHVEIFTDESRSIKLADIRANKVIDWSARYNFTQASGETFGAVGRKGGRSLFKATYTVFDKEGDDPIFIIEEENPMAKFIDGFLGEIPIIGLVFSMLFNPKYIAKRVGSESPVMRLTKQPALFEGKFILDELVDVTEVEEQVLLFSFLMLNLLERGRG